MAKILVIDIETTDLEPRDGNIVEIGGVLLDTKTFEIKTVFSQLINEGPEMNTGAWIFWNSNLKPEMVQKEGKKIDEIREGFQKLLDSYVTIAYNQTFDFKWLENRGFKITKRGKDPMGICTDILKIPGNRGYSSYKWPKVQECLNYFEIKEIEPHRASADAMLEARIVAELIKRNQYEVLESLMIADTTELQIARYKAKIRLNHELISAINDTLEDAIADEEGLLEDMSEHPKEHLVKVQSMNESVEHLISHINEKTKFCEQAIEKLKA